MINKIADLLIQYQLVNRIIELKTILLTIVKINTAVITFFIDCNGQFAQVANTSVKRIEMRIPYQQLF